MHAVCQRTDHTSESGQTQRKQGVQTTSSSHPSPFAIRPLPSCVDFSKAAALSPVHIFVCVNHLHIHHSVSLHLAHCHRIEISIKFTQKWQICFLYFRFLLPHKIDCFTHCVLLFLLLRIVSSSLGCNSSMNLHQLSKVERVGEDDGALVKIPIHKIHLLRKLHSFLNSIKVAIFENNHILFLLFTS